MSSSLFECNIPSAQENSSAKDGTLGNGRKSALEILASFHLAVSFIAVLFFASLAGWIAQELLPADFPERVAFYSSKWHPKAVKAISILRLYDPFHSIWYRFILAIFSAVLVACIVSRFPKVVLRSLKVEPPSRLDELRRRTYVFECSWRKLLAGIRGERDTLLGLAEKYGQQESIDVETLERSFGALSKLFSRRGYRIVANRGDDFFSFVAHSGRLSDLGSTIFHVGLIVIAIGGLVGSLLGWREMVYLGEGESTRIENRPELALHVKDFSILTTPMGDVRDYLSEVKIMDEKSDTIASGLIEVNHPLSFRGINVYQSSFMLTGSGYSRASLSYSEPGDSQQGKSFELMPGKGAPIAGGDLVVYGLRLVPDFRMGPSGAFSASELPLNPALEVEVKGPQGEERGWLFLRHPGFNSQFQSLPRLILADIELSYLTGLEISSNPGAGILLVGFAVCTVGLAIAYTCNKKIIKGFVSREGLVIAGAEYRWKASFEREFGELREEIKSIYDAGVMLV